MSNEGYQPLPTTEVDEDSVLRFRSRTPHDKERSRSRSHSPTHRRLHRALAEDSRFDMPNPPVWKRVLLLLFLGLLFYMVWALRSAGAQQRTPKVVHAQRYSKEYKYRPAASPIVTERLKDGRTRVRGAAPTAGIYVPAMP